jgi:hypothetical protein
LYTVPAIATSGFFVSTEELVAARNTFFGKAFLASYPTTGIAVVVAGGAGSAAENRIGCR